MKTKKKYLQFLLSAPLKLYVRFTHLLSQQYRKLNRHQFLKGLFFATLVICLSFGQLVSAQTPNASLLVEQGIEDYNNSNFHDAIKHWRDALKQYKNNPSATAVINENLGRAYQQIGENKKAIKSLSAAISDYRRVENIQQVGRMQTELAQVYTNLGQPYKSIELLCGNLAENNSETFTDEDKKNEEIKCTPQSAEQIASNTNDEVGKVAALGVLGEAYRLLGNYDQAIEYLKKAKEVAPDNFLVLNSLGNAHRNRAQLLELRTDSAKKLRLFKKENQFSEQSKDDYKQSRKYFQDSTNSARKQKQPSAEMRGLLNLIQLDSQTNLMKGMDDATFNDTVKNALKILNNLPDSTTKIYGAIDLAYLQRNSQATSPFTNCPTELFLPDNQALSLLQQSVLTSKNLQDSRLQSYANGALGHFWECRKDNQKALKYTQSAIIAADSKLGAKDSLYLWEWQAGRILDKQQRKKEAIASYQRAFETLEGIRQDILTAKRDVQFDFRDVVRPLYRTLAQSRLELLARVIGDNQRSEELSKVVTTIDALKLAELQNYFGNDCILSGLNPKQVDELLSDKENSVAFKNTAFLSSIILDGKTGILLQLPKQENNKQETKFKLIEDPNQQGENKIVSTDKLEKTITEFRKGLVRGKATRGYDTTIAAQLYDWIIRPFAEDIKPEKIQTLVFIQDGFLRSVPMAALYDNQQQKYLVEKYAIATTPSLRLTTPKPPQNKQKALILGLQKEAKVDGKTFIQLSGVKEEVDAVKKLFPNYTNLIDDDFIPDTFQQELKKTTYPIVHIASHAQFGIIPEDTFIVAGQDKQTGENKKLTISQLENSLRNLQSKSDRVELLALTACQTAVGDDRATLGLAGVALQVGVKSAIASLWNIPDESTPFLVEKFYQNYSKKRMSIAQALQKAQIDMINIRKDGNIESTDPKIKYNNPAYWAPMIVIGNWL
ncbi:MAG: CHAT domain-containing protein [Nostocaceae cyanobacterium]|nr:CHAT domain-containing protein [Nostocaceae cyanobacterium]